jgi:hypothetical protein
VPRLIYSGVTSPLLKVYLLKYHSFTFGVLFLRVTRLLLDLNGLVQVFQLSSCDVVCACYECEDFAVGFVQTVGLGRQVST